MKKVYIKTYGCQMNEHDSARICSILASMGYLPVESPESADLIVVNTCSVRENPENKVYSLLGKLRPLKKKRPELMVAICGCVAQQEGERILEREPIVDLVFGPDRYFNLPELLSRVESGEKVCDTHRGYPRPPIEDFIPDEWIDRGHRENIKAYIVISKGCNNKCSFCIVPRTRGREVYRTPDSILKEVDIVVSEGVREIWLLGQNVNSYKCGENYRFYHLLRDVANNSDVWRIRFTSPHPKDWVYELTDLISEKGNIAKHIHLPLQSGSNKILKLMRRGHTIEKYLEQVNYLRKKIPGIEISTDLIVGFPTETEEDYEETLRVVKEVKFSQVYPFKYSPRPGTYAEKLGDDVPRKIKEERLANLIKLQEEINIECMTKLIGASQEVLIEEKHPKKDYYWNGRTNGYRPITVRAKNLSTGDLVVAEVKSFHGHWLEGDLVRVVKKSPLLFVSNIRNIKSEEGG
ncbi:MAG: tRNA (N6-isopentenyl adenosine(37)-C2)-methylthiotransferase MiaB [Candidatus Hydrogenedentes bacterium]|nr:tRNA (N6-isopentenyl adenosine(37)-C2)-methylthiotransferase MiaB [Candidatus Hydrogenedentota bacterium]